jgi:ankyrin repeat protein
LNITASEIRKIESLFIACMAGDLKGVMTILDYELHTIDGENKFGIEIDPKGYNRKPIHAATIVGSIEIVKYLLERGANVNIQNKFGDTALHFAVHHNRALIIEILLKAHANPIQKNNIMKTPIDIAKEQNKEEFVKQMSRYEKNFQEEVGPHAIKKLLNLNRK